MWGKNPAQGFKNPAGFLKPCGVFNFDLFFHYDRIFILGSKCICFTNLRLYLCIKVVLSILYHQKGDVILPNSGAAKKNWWLLKESAVLETFLSQQKKKTTVIYAKNTDASCTQQVNDINGKKYLPFQ